MTTVDHLRNTLIDKLMTIKNKGYLDSLNRLIDKTAVKKEPYVLSDAQMEMLMMSEEDIKQGRLVSQQQLDDEDLEWLNRG